MSGRSAVPLLARRFLASRQSDRFLGMIAWVSVLGTSLGVLALTVVTSVINGFQGELSRVITGMNGDVVLYSRGEAISDPDRVEQKIRAALPNTVGITRSFIAELMASGPSGVAGVVLEGADLGSVRQVTLLADRVVEGRLPRGAGEYAIGASLAERLGLKLGSEFRLIAPFAGDVLESESGAVADQAAAPKAVDGKVTGIVRMGMHEYDSKFVFAPISAVQKLLELPGRATSFKIKLEPGADARVAADRLTDNFGYPFRAKSWSQLNQNLFYAIQLEKVVISIILTIIVIVAAFNMASTLMMMIHDKAKEISILKAIGLRPGQGFRLFCLIGMGIGVLGTVVGLAGGLALNWVLARTRLIELPPGVYHIGFLPVMVNWTEVAMIAAAAMLIAFAATVYPAYKVSTRSPLDGIRYE